MMNVLFLSAWYPHRNDAMSGLFVRKHAEAVSIYAHVEVLYVKEDQNITHFEIVQNTGNIKETIVYYPTNRFRVIRALLWFFALCKGYKHLKKCGFSPDIIHANILTRYGLVAYILSNKEHVPYVISEHWSRYLKENYSYRGILRKVLTNFVVRNAAYVMPVSNVLKQGMIDCGLKSAKYQVVHNTIDNLFYEEYPTTTFNSKKRFLHISCFDNSSKNILGIIDAVANLEKIRTDWELIMIGTGTDLPMAKEYAKFLGVKSVKFIGEQSPKNVAQWLHSSDCVVQFSNYETFGIVLIESLACGTPIITTHSGIADEVITNNTGLVIDSKDTSELVNKMTLVLDNAISFNKMEMKTVSSRYKQEIIGEELSKIYQKAIAER